MRKIFNYKVVSIIIIIMCLLMNIIYGIQIKSNIMKIIILICLNVTNFLYFVELIKNIYRSALLLIIHNILQAIYNGLYVNSDIAKLLIGLIFEILMPLLMLIIIQRSKNKDIRINIKQNIRNEVPMINIGVRHKIILYIMLAIMILQVAVDYNFDYITNTYFMRVIYSLILLLPTILTLSTYTFTNVTIDIFFITLIAETVIIITGFETSAITASQILMLITEYIIMIYLFINTKSNIPNIESDNKEDKA